MSLWTMVECPLCGKIGYDDERTKVGSQYPCFSCLDEFTSLCGF